MLFFSRVYFIANPLLSSTPNCWNCKQVLFICFIYRVYSRHKNLTIDLLYLFVVCRGSSVKKREYIILSIFSFVDLRAFGRNSIFYLLYLRICTIKLKFSDRKLKINKIAHSLLHYFGLHWVSASDKCS